MGAPWKDIIAEYERRSEMDQGQTEQAGGKRKRLLLIGIVVGTVACLLALGSIAIYAADGVFGVAVTVEDGKASYSTDGKVWNDGLPPEEIEGEYSITAIEDEDVSAIESAGTIPDGVTNLVVKTEDGKTQFSTDGGKTWRDEAPAGVNVEKDDSVGTVTVSSGSED
jgi:hypothetical protein